MTLSTAVGEYTVTGSSGPAMRQILVTQALARGIKPRDITACTDDDLLDIQLELAERYGEYTTLELYVPGSVTRFDYQDGRTGYGITATNML